MCLYSLVTCALESLYVPTATANTLAELAHVSSRCNSTGRLFEPGPPCVVPESLACRWPVGTW